MKNMPTCENLKHLFRMNEIFNPNLSKNYFTYKIGSSQLLSIKRH